MARDDLGSDLFRSPTTPLSAGRVGGCPLRLISCSPWIELWQVPLSSARGTARMAHPNGWFYPFRQSVLIAEAHVKGS